MKPISFSIDMPVLLVVLAAVALGGHGAVYQIISLKEPIWSTWLVIAIYGVWLQWLWTALSDVTKDRLASAITCFIPSLIPAAVFESVNAFLVPVTVVLMVSRLFLLRDRRHADLIMLCTVAVIAVLFVSPELQPDLPARDRVMPLVLLLPVCVFGLMAGWRQPLPACCALLCLGLVGARLLGFSVSLIPVLFLAPMAAAPAVVYALREIPQKQSFVMWMALPTVMYSLFWVAMMPIRPHFYPFTMTSWAG